MKTEYLASAPTQSDSSSKKTDNGSLKKIIRDLGLKVTQQRISILERLVREKRHFTAQQLFEEISPTSPDLGFATVYRFLKTLSEHGYVSEMRTRGLPARYEWAAREHHDHLTCVSCGKICEFENPAIEQLQNEIASQFGFQLTDHILELFGRCANCRFPTEGEQLPSGRGH